MANEGQGIKVTAPPAPSKGEDVLPWASALMRWLRREMPSFGSGLTTEYGPGRMVRAALAGASSTSPFAIRDASTQGDDGEWFFTMVPGTIKAQGGTSEIPVWSDTVDEIDELPLRVVPVPYDDAVVLIDVQYDEGENWGGTVIRVEANEAIGEEPAFDYADTFQHGFKLIARLRRLTSEAGVRSLAITQSAGGNYQHTKCNIIHSFNLVSEQPSSPVTTMLVPQLFSDPIPPVDGYLYYNVYSQTLRLYVGGYGWRSL